MERNALHVLGVVENLCIQHRGIRAAYGWLESPRVGFLIGVNGFNSTYLFKVVYIYRRPDVWERCSLARGFLGEVVYGNNDLRGRMKSYPNNTGILLGQITDIVGHVSLSAATVSTLSLVDVL